MRKNKWSFTIISLIFTFGLYFFYKSQDYQETYTYLEFVEGYPVEDIGHLKIYNRGTWKDDVYAEPYDLYVTFSSQKRITQIAIKKIIFYCDDVIYGSASAVNKGEHTSDNKYYFRYRFLKSFPDNSRIKYEITLSVEEQEYCVEIPVTLVRKTWKNNRLLLPFQQ